MAEYAHYGKSIQLLSVVAAGEEGGLAVGVFGDGDVAAFAEAGDEQVVKPVAFHVLGGAAAEGVRLAAELDVGVEEGVLGSAAGGLEVVEECQGAGVSLTLHEGAGVGEFGVGGLLLHETLFEEGGYSLVFLSVFAETPVAVGAEGCED